MSNSKVKVAVPKRLKKYRLEYGSRLTIYDLAEELGVHFSSISYWENGKKYPRHEKIIALEDFFGKSYRDMFTDLTEAEAKTLEQTIIDNR